VKNYLALMFGGLCLLSGCGGGSSTTPPARSLNLALASLAFGVWVVGTESGPQVETLSNTGGAELSINSVAIAGTNATDFDQSNTCGSGLAAGASCTLSVTFTPSQLGQRIASITIADDAGGSPQVLSLSGVGGVAGPNCTLSQTSSSFGNEAIGTSSPAQSISLSNYGTATLGIAGIAASTNFAQTNTCNSTLSSGANCTIDVTFAPSQGGNLTATISVTDNAPDSPHTVALSGTGTPGATTKDTLTGYCWGGVHHGAPNQCGTGQNLTECPVGAPAITPTTVDGCLPPASALVDQSRTCSFRTYSGQSGSGYCVVQY
jgi:centrosomal CEP192-like protein/HYDIN/CFA65/VesB family protein